MTDYTKLATVTSTDDESTYTFSAVALGLNTHLPKIVSVAGRSIEVFQSGQLVTAPGLVSRVRVGGVDLKKITQILGSLDPTVDAKSTVSMWIGLVPLAGSRDIVVDFTVDGTLDADPAPQLRCMLEIGEANVELQPAGYAVSSNDERGIQVPIAVPEGGLIVAVDTMGTDGSPTLSLTGLANITTEILVNTSAFAVANEGNLSAQSRDIIFLWSVTSGDDSHCVAVASFTPASASAVSVSGDLEVPAFFDGVTAEENVTRHRVIAIASTIHADFSGSVGWALKLSGSDPDLVITILKNGTVIGTATFIEDSNSNFIGVTFDAASPSNSDADFSFSPGDRLSFQAPATFGSWREISLTILLERNT